MQKVNNFINCSGVASRAIAKIVLTFFLLIFVFYSTANALPQDGIVRAGNVDFDQVNSKRLNVNQGTDKAIVDWRSFGIAGDEHTHFQLPSNNSINLSRITGGQRSDIFGQLSSNGQLMLINPNGVVFGQNSRIDVHGLVATTNDIRNDDFLANRFNFNIPGNPSGMIINRGTINIGNAGLLAFVAPGVENSGIINANLGRVGLASSNRFSLDLYGDELISIGVEGKILEKVYGADGQPISSLVDQSGTINADGGQVFLQANAARDIVDHAINVSGIIEAKTAQKKRGDIILNGGKEGKVKVSGVLNVSGLESGQSGGTVHVLGDEVLLEKARVFASGFNGGGTVLVGGDYQGKGSVLNARNNYFDVNSEIYADATYSGDGGKVILWADERTDAFGRIYARGGPFGGNGGFVETSGKQRLVVTQAADVSAPLGKSGEWLLDPFDIEIVDSLSNAALTGGNKVDVAIINAALNNGTSVTIKSNNNGAGEGNILLTSAISKSSGGDATLTLDAAGGITINNTVTSTSGALTFDLLAATGVVINNTLTLNGGSTTLNSNETFSRTNFENPGRQNIVQINHLSGASRPAEVHISGTPSGLVHISGNQNTANSSAGHGTSITLNGTSATNEISTSGGSVTFQDAVELASAEVGIDSSGSSSDGSITFNGALNGAQNLSLTAATGNVAFNGIGGTTALTGLTVGSSTSTTFTGDSTFDGDVNISATNGVSILGSWVLSNTGSTDSINADSDADGVGTFSLGSSSTLANSGLISITGGDFDFQGIHNGNTLDLIWNSLERTMGIGDATGDARIDNDELGRLRSFQLSAGGAFFRTSGGTINIDNAQKISNGVDFRATNINFTGGESAFNQLVFRGENVNLSTTVSATGLVIGDQITSLNFINNSSLVTSSIGSGGGTGDSLRITGTNLNMSSGSSIDSGTGKLTLNFSEGMTLGLLKTSSSSDTAMNLTAGSGGIRDADTDGLDISALNGGLVVSATGGFGTFDNPIEFDVRSSDIPTSQDFSSTSALAEETFTSSFGQSLQTVSTTRTLRATSEAVSTVTSVSVNSLDSSPVQAISDNSLRISPFITNIFSQSFSLIETSTTTTSTTSTFFSSGDDNALIGNIFATEALNNNLSTGIFSQTDSNDDLGIQSNPNLGLESLAQTSIVSRMIRTTSITRSFQSQSFRFGSTQFGGRIPIGSRSLGTIRTIGGGLATCMLSPRGTVRAMNVLVDSNGGINNQNNFNNVGLGFTPSPPPINTRDSSVRMNSNISNNEAPAVRGNISGNETPPSSQTSGSISPLDQQMTDMRNRLTGDGRTRSNSSITNSNTSGNGTLSVQSTPNQRMTNMGNQTRGGGNQRNDLTPSNVEAPTINANAPANETPNVIANISGSETSVGARISGSDTPGFSANISGGETSIGARISGGESPSFSANISGGETSVGARISGEESLPIASANTETGSESVIRSRTNDRNLNNPDQFQGNDNAEQRSLSSRISGNETPGKGVNNSLITTNRQNHNDQNVENRQRFNDGNPKGSGNAETGSEPVIRSRTNDRNINNPDQFQGNANAEQRSLDARISGSDSPNASSNISNNIRNTNRAGTPNLTNESSTSITENNSPNPTIQTGAFLRSRTNDRNLNNADQLPDNANAELSPIDARTSGSSTTSVPEDNITGDLDDQMSIIRNRLVGGDSSFNQRRNSAIPEGSTENQNSLVSGISEQTLEQRMRDIYTRVVGNNQSSNNDSEEESEN